MTDITITMVVSIVAAAVSFLSVIFVALTIYSQRALNDRSSSDYNRKINRAELSDMREYYEQQIATLSNRLTATQERWIDANHLIMSAQRPQNNTYSGAIDPSRFLRSFGVDIDNTTIQNDLVFYLTPFSKSQMREYETVKAVCSESGLVCRRGDEKYVGSNILSHVIKSIAKSRIIVANINGRNPNVLYELGIAQALGKPSIIISKTLDELPFDIQSNRVITFNTYPELERELKTALIAALTEEDRKPAIRKTVRRRNVRALPRRTAEG